MATEKDILEQMTVEQLDGFLRREVYGMGIFMLSTIYRICTILSVREPHRGSAKDIFLEFAGHYADCRFLSED